MVVPDSSDTSSIADGDAVEFKEDFSKDVAGEGRRHFGLGLRALVTHRMRSTDVDKDECLILIPAYRQGRDFMVVVPTSVLGQVDDDSLKALGSRLAPKPLPPGCPKWCFLCFAQVDGDETVCAVHKISLVPLPGWESQLMRLPYKDGSEVELASLIIRGRQSMVYKGTLGGGAPCAVKVARKDCLDFKEAAKDIRDEAMTLKDLDHPGIVRFLHYGIDEKIGPYLVMEYAAGVMLSEVVYSLSMSRSLSIAIAAAEALVYLHSIGIVHPMLTQKDVMILDSVEAPVRLLDFSKARVVGHPNGTYSINGVLAGFNCGLSPEILMGRPNSKAANVYSLAAITHEMFSAAPLFKEKANLVQTWEAVVCDPAPLLSQVRPDLDLPKELVETIHNCLAIKAEARPSAQELLNALQKSLSILAMRGKSCP